MDERQRRIELKLHDNRIANKSGLEQTRGYCEAFIDGEVEIEGKMKHSEEYIEAYRAGFHDGADCKQNFKLHMLGYEVEELLKIIQEHEMSKENDLNIKIVRAMAKSNYSGAIVMMELDRAGLKIVPK